MLNLYLALFAAAVAAADQVTKYLTVRHIAPGENIPVLPGVFHLTYMENTGAAFSILEGKTGFFLLISVLFLALVITAVVKKWFRRRSTLFALAAVTGGAVGNLIDRVLHGYVVDMIEVEFIRFAVFNVADCFITCGAVALVLCVLLEDLEEKRK